MRKDARKAEPKFSCTNQFHVQSGNKDRTQGQGTHRHACSGQAPSAPAVPWSAFVHLTPCSLLVHWGAWQRIISANCKKICLIIIENGWGKVLPLFLTTSLFSFGIIYIIYYYTLLFTVQRQSKEHKLFYFGVYFGSCRINPFSILELCISSNDSWARKNTTCLSDAKENLQEWQLECFFTVVKAVDRDPRKITEMQPLSAILTVVL